MINRLFLEQQFVYQRRLAIFSTLALCVVLSLTSAFLLRFDLAIPDSEYQHVLIGLAIFVPVKLIVFRFAGMHRGWWVSFCASDVLKMIVGVFTASVLTTIITLLVVGRPFPRSVYVLEFVLNVGTIAGMRVLLRLYRERPVWQVDARPQKAVLIYGAGWAGAGLLREIRANPRLGLKVMGFLDDNPAKQGEAVMGVNVLGPGTAAAGVVQQMIARGVVVDEILIAMPSATGSQMREAIANCRVAEVPCRALPDIGDLLTNKSLSRQIRDISVEDLLCRQPVELDTDEIRTTLHGRSVLVSGAAGSIGSELCRQIADFAPKMLIIVDRAESNLFHVDMELRNRYPSVTVVPKVSDVCDYESMTALMEEHRVDCVFHAAAYKHVPLMELHPIEAAQNNVCGTWSLARAARECGVKSFVMISSDKAVNPTNIMGLTKRIAELVVSSLSPSDQDGKTRFVSVRFGNVLASSGSVVPIFQRQIANGGPVTVTHPEVRRYFMTIREAVQLVLQAQTMGSGSEVFVLDMGEPVKIVDLAKNMIRLAGFVPDEDVEIRFMGLRPGEKLYEELITGGEYIVPTSHDKIKIFQGESVGREGLENWIRQLIVLLEAKDEPAIVRHMADLVPEYQMSSFWQERVSIHTPTPTMSQTVIKAAHQAV